MSGLRTSPTNSEVFDYNLHQSDKYLRPTNVPFTLILTDKLDIKCLGCPFYALCIHKPLCRTLTHSHVV